MGQGFMLVCLVVPGWFRERASPSGDLRDARIFFALRLAGV